MTFKKQVQHSSFSLNKNINPFNARDGHCSGRDISGHNSPAAGAGDLFKPSTDLRSLLASIKHFFLVLCLGFSLGGFIIGACFHLVATFTWPGRQRAIFRSRFFGN